MVYRPRHARWTALVPVLLFACAGGADPDELTSFGGPGPASNAVASTADMQGTTSSTAPTDGTGRETTTEDMRETTTESPDPGTTAEITTVSTGPDDATGTGDESSTTGPVVLCGNGMIDAPEECDGADLGMQNCATIGFSGGNLVCTAQCIFDKSMCTSPSCGDATVDPGEECDCGNQGAQCTALQLGNAMCSTLPSPNGGNYSAGNLACNSPTSCSFNKAGCVYCGDGIKNAAEVCDGPDLGGQSCATQGFVGGPLSCTPQCGFNTGGCTSCGNGIVDAGETCDGTNFNGQSCQSINPGKFAGGSLSCSGCNNIGTGACNSGNCCVLGPVAACSVTAIRDCVCGGDPFCCNNSWDQYCVDRAKNTCGAQC